MLYIIAIICPPLALLFAGKPGQLLLNLPLCVLGYLPGIIHALMVVAEAKADKRMDRLARKINRG